MNIVKARAYFKTRHSGLPAVRQGLSRIAFRIRRFWMLPRFALSYKNDISGGLKKGQSLVEVLVSLSIATLVLSAITVTVIYSLRNTQFSKNQNLASQYAAEGMEIVRKIRDSKSSLSGFLGDNNSSISYCLPQDSQTLVAKERASCGQNVGRLDIGPTPSANYLYVREITIDPPDPDAECKTNYKVTVMVSWWDNVCGQTANFCHKVNLISCLADRKNSVQKP